MIKFITILVLLILLGTCVRDKNVLGIIICVGAIMLVFDNGDNEEL